MQSSAGKSLSNGTMSLRFMQNALRSKQQTAVDLERAKVKDDAEWEVSKEVREAWGLSGSGRQRDPSVSCESSYLPFMFSSDHETNASSSEDESTQVSMSVKPSGRRTFDDGREVITSPATVDEGKTFAEVPISPKPIPPKQEPEQLAPTGGKGSRVGRPGLLASGKGERNLRKDLLFQRDPSSRKPSNVNNMAKGAPVLQMISEQTTRTVGVDLRASRQPNFDSEKPSGSSSKGPLSFLRPVGVDNPVAGGSRPVKRSRGNSVSEDPNRATPKADADGLGDDEQKEERRKKKKKQKKRTLSDDTVQ